MAVEVKRKQNESIESIMRRFKTMVMQSGVQFRVKQTMFRQKKLSYTKKKQKALRKQQIQAKRQYLQRIGKLPLDEKQSTYTAKRVNTIK